MQPGRQVKLSKIWNEVFKEGSGFPGTPGDWNREG